ncbi:hypothetical protein KY328_05265 [Candidatus Woesearchaeota archaeon]|nr:hypothetical protein [Candidatus Woesearchaeota archaeon]MBW3022307.1 hypothetical protein [Candidatus Woesearchaeota archaeon]
MEEYPDTKEDAEDYDEDDDYSAEDAAYDAHNMVDALIQVLQRKGIVTEDEVDAEVDRLLEEADKEEEQETQ